MRVRQGYQRISVSVAAGRQIVTSQSRLFAASVPTRGRSLAGEQRDYQIL